MPLNEKADGIGILLTNLGTPEAPTAAAVRRYLAEFLSDPRVVEIPRALWWPILHGIILRVRPRRSAHAYASIWTPEGSPLLAIAQRQAAAVDFALQKRVAVPLRVALAMRYGQPAIGTALRTLRDQGARRILIFPLYPQYAAATTASTLDAVTTELRGWRRVPELRFVADYHADPAYIAALAQSVRAHWAVHGQGERLLISFHGIPQRCVAAGDPYYDQCLATAQRLTQMLALADDRWALSFQSRFGREAWLQPYTEQTLKTWGRAGLASVQVICPGFSADCLETLEEIAVLNRGFFQNAGGGDYQYIPALNDRPEHIEALVGVCIRQLGGWLS